MSHSSAEAEIWLDLCGNNRDATRSRSREFTDEKGKGKRRKKRCMFWRATLETSDARAARSRVHFSRFSINQSSTRERASANPANEIRDTRLQQPAQPGISSFSLARVTSFPRRETLTLIENVVTHIFQFMSASLYAAEYTTSLPTARVHARKILFSSTCLRRTGGRAKSSRSRLTAAVRASYERSKICA